ncbi:hypothetical protein MMJ02_10250 [Enterococcus cecorum]|nr:hypothetical protein [Enterococcus cecorum]MCJ0602201.1 hypothetical protein [Enterococcus cecorum]
MSLLNNIKKTCQSTTTFIKNIFNIKDDNITFPTYTDALSEEEVHGVPSKVFSGLLSPTLKIHTVALNVAELVPSLNIRLKLA